jgi:predicted transcriptional regulator
MNYSGKIIKYFLQYEAFQKHIKDLFSLTQFVSSSHSSNTMTSVLYHALKGENEFDKFEFGVIAKDKAQK